MAQFGIWKFDSGKGLVGSPENLPEHFLTLDKLWDVEETSLGAVWKWPLVLARNYWFSPSVANDFNKAFFYAHKCLEEKRPQQFPKDLDLDSRTVLLQSEILSDYFPGPEEAVTFS